MEAKRSTAAVEVTTLPAASYAAPRSIAPQRAGALSLPTWLTVGALFIYLITRLTALPEFPIYFFTDEAAQTMHAYDLLHAGFRSPQGELLPVYFQNGPQYNLSVSVYLQVLPTFLFGKSIWVTRGTAALATLLAAFSVGLILNRIFQRRTAWAGVLLLAITPAWFLHTRTAFETTLAASLYAAFLYSYLSYRAGNARWLYGAVICGALAFYTYTPMRAVMLISAALLLLSDLRYHLAHKKTLLRALGLAFLLALPMLRFLLAHPGATGRHLQLLGSYWLEDISAGAKLARMLTEYLRGLNPGYWYFPHNDDLARHTMAGYGHLLLPLLPFGMLGIFLALRNLRDPRWRVLLIAVLAAPGGAALVRLGITRSLVMVIPMVLLSALALDTLLEWLRSSLKIPRTALAWSVFCLLSVGNLLMLRDALVNGPTWFDDYSLTGMQYGARQVFTEIAAHLRNQPQDKIILSPAWTNGADVVARFFFSDPLPFELGSPSAFSDAARPLSPETLVIMLPNELASLPRSHFSKVQIEKIVRWPDGRPGFYFTRLAYVDGVQEIVAREKAERLQRLQINLAVNGQPAVLTYPRLDIGTPEALFDGLPETLARSWAINPLLLDLEFPAPVAMQSVTLRVGGVPTNIKVSAWEDGKSTPETFSRALVQSAFVRDEAFQLPQPARIRRLQIEVANSGEPANANVHIWEVELH